MAQPVGLQYQGRSQVSPGVGLLLLIIDRMQLAHVCPGLAQR